MHHRRERRSRRPIRRERSGRGLAGRDHSCDLERHLRRCGSSLARGAVHAGAYFGRPACKEGNEANRDDRVGRSHRAIHLPRTRRRALVPRQGADTASARPVATERARGRRKEVSLPGFQLLRPKTLDEAIALMARYDGNVKVIAGGTDLLPSMKQKLFTPTYVLDLRGIGELRGIRNVPGEGVVIGALTTLSAIEHSPLIRKDYPVLYEAARTVASPVLRNMGTIGGNLCLDTRCLWY